MLVVGLNFKNPTFGKRHFNTLTGYAVDRCDLPDRAGHFPPDINVYAISNFLPSSFVLNRFFLYQIVCN